MRCWFSIDRLGKLFTVSLQKVTCLSSFQVEDAVSRVAEGTPSAALELDISSFRSQLGPLGAVSTKKMVFYSFFIFLL